MLTEYYKYENGTDTYIFRIEYKTIYTDIAYDSTYCKPNDPRWRGTSWVPETIKQRAKKITYNEMVLELL